MKYLWEYFCEYEHQRHVHLLYHSMHSPLEKGSALDTMCDPLDDPDVRSCTWKTHYTDQMMGWGWQHFSPHYLHGQKFMPMFLFSIKIGHFYLLNIYVIFFNQFTNWSFYLKLTSSTVYLKHMYILVYKYIHGSCRLDVLVV